MKKFHRKKELKNPIWIAFTFVGLEENITCVMDWEKDVIDLELKLIIQLDSLDQTHTQIMSFLCEKLFSNFMDDETDKMRGYFHLVSRLARLHNLKEFSSNYHFVVKQEECGFLYSIYYKDNFIPFYQDYTKKIFDYKVIQEKEYEELWNLYLDDFYK